MIATEEGNVSVCLHWKRHIQNVYFSSIGSGPCNISVIKVWINICKINTFKSFFSTKDFAWHNSSIFVASLVSIVRICSSQDMFSSNITPKKFIADFLSILFSAVFKGRSFSEDFLWKIVYLTFLLFRNNLFALNQSPFFYSFSVNIFKNGLIFWWDIKIIVSSTRLVTS